MGGGAEECKGVGSGGEMKNVGEEGRGRRGERGVIALTCPNVRTYVSVMEMNVINAVSHTIELGVRYSIYTTHKSDAK